MSKISYGFVISHPYSSFDIFTFHFYDSVKESKQAFLKTILKEKKGVKNCMSIFDYDEAITAYSLKQAIEDGVLVEIFKKRWSQLSGGKAIVVTRSRFEEVSQAALMEIWNEFVRWTKEVMPTLPEEERLFASTMNGRKVWVIEDGAAFTLMYPEDY